MAMIACAGCGLPREEGETGVVPCPVCAAASLAEPIAQPATQPALPDPTAALPADVSQMEAGAVPFATHPFFLSAVLGAFVLGMAAGAAGLLAWQHSQTRGERAQDPTPSDLATLRQPPDREIEVVPLPHAPSRAGSEKSPGSESVREPGSKESHQPPRGGPAPVPPVIVSLNQPDTEYTVAEPVGRGEHLILRGQVRMLRVNGLHPGAILDASELKAGSIYVGGKLEGGSVLRIRCADGVVEVPAAVGGRSRLEIDAPGGSVRFSHCTTPEWTGSRIAGGSTVLITGRTVDLRGDVDGEGTSVRVTLTRNGSLRVAAVRDRATVHYRSEDPQEADPPARATLVEPTATFRKVSGPRRPIE